MQAKGRDSPDTRTLRNPGIGAWMPKPAAGSGDIILTADQLKYDAHLATSGGQGAF